MSDYGEFCHDLKEQRRELRDRLGVNCPGCKVKEPKRIPSILLPQQRCKVCGYKDPRSQVGIYRQETPENQGGK
jgi:hypothetical protein